MFMRLFWKALRALGWTRSGRDWLTADGRDLRVPEKFRSQWIEIGVFAVKLTLAEEGLGVEVLPNGAEMEEPLTGCFAYTIDAEVVIAERGALHEEETVVSLC